jgi:hypothetical protein
MQHDDSDFYGMPTIGGPLFEALEDTPFARSPVRPAKEEALVGGLIWKHRGRSNPVSIARLRELTGLSERQVKGVVEQLVTTHKMRIGGRREEPSGYFMVESAEDLDAAVKPYKAQIIAMWRRLRVLEAPQGLKELLGQLKLED